MALDFPSSPTNGQYYNGFVYNAANETWDSAYAPRAATIPISSPNYLINGAFDIWQRGTSVSVAGNGYGVDRWTNNANVTSTISQQTTGMPAGANFIARIAPASSGTVNFVQLVETLNAKQLWGKTVTFSGKIRRNAALTQEMTVTVEKSATVDAGLGAAWTGIASATLTAASLPTGTTSVDWYTFSVSVAIPADGTANTLKFGINSGTLPAGAYYELALMQVEVGALTDFRRNAPSLQAELAACQRYYFKTAGGPWYTGIAFIDVEDSSWSSMIYPVAMRVNPTVTINADGANTIRSYGGLPVRAVTGYIGTACGLNFLYHDGGYTVGRVHSGHITANAEF